MHEGTLKKAYKAFFLIGSAKDFRKHDLSMADYKALRHVLKNLHNEGLTTTIQEKVKNWCVRHNLPVSAHGIGWEIMRPRQNKEGKRA